jgi:hypothetical protein
MDNLLLYLPLLTVGAHGLVVRYVYGTSQPLTNKTISSISVPVTETSVDFIRPGVSTGVGK